MMSLKSQDAAAYFAIAANSPVLGREEELALAKRYRETGCKQSADKLTLSMMRFVITVAMRYVRSGLPLSDLIAEGSVGVLKALQKFEPERGLRFVTFAAYWIRAEIGAAVLKNRSVVTSAGLRPKVLRKLQTERRAAEAECENGGEADLEDLAERMGVTPHEMSTMLSRLDVRDVSVDAVAAPGEQPLLERLADDLESPEDQVARSRWAQALPESVDAAMDVLDERERFIAEARLMACPDEELTLADVGRHLSVTRERARQLETRAKAKLRGRLEPVRPSLAVAA